MSELPAAGLDRPVVAVANRLPVQRGDDGWQLSPGGLVTALLPVMSAHPGAWVGWDGGTRGMPPTLPDSGVRLVPIGLTAILLGCALLVVTMAIYFLGRNRMRTTAEGFSSGSS